MSGRTANFKLWWKFRWNSLVSYCNWDKNFQTFSFKSRPGSFVFSIFWITFCKFPRSIEWSFNDMMPVGVNYYTLCLNAIHSLYLTTYLSVKITIIKYFTRPRYLSDIDSTKRNGNREKGSTKQLDRVVQPPRFGNISNTK